MAPVEKVEAPVAKELAEAGRAVAGLHKALAPVVSKLPKSVPAEKARPAWRKVNAFLKRYAPVTKVMGSPVFDMLSPQSQAGLRWLDETIAEMMKLEDALRKAAKVEEIDFAKDPEKVVKAIRKAAKEIDPPPWVPMTLVKIERELKVESDEKKRTEALVKLIQKGEEIGGIPGGAVSSLALLLLLHVIWKYLSGRIDGRPRG